MWGKGHILSQYQKGIKIDFNIVAQEMGYFCVHYRRRLMQKAHIRNHKFKLFYGATSTTIDDHWLRIENDNVSNWDGEGHYIEPEALKVCCHAYGYCERFADRTITLHTIPQKLAITSEELLVLVQLSVKFV